MMEAEPHWFLTAHGSSALSVTTQRAVAGLPCWLIIGRSGLQD